MDGNELSEKKVEVLVQREQTIAEVSHGVFSHLEHLVHYDLCHCKCSIICYCRISNLLPVFKTFNWIMSWSARFKTSPVYKKSKLGQQASTYSQKAGPTRALDGLLLRVHSQWSFACADKATGEKLQNTIWERG